MQQPSRRCAFRCLETRYSPCVRLYGGCCCGSLRLSPPLAQGSDTQAGGRRSHHNGTISRANDLSPRDAPSALVMAAGGTPPRLPPQRPPPPHTHPHIPPPP